MLTEKDSITASCGGRHGPFHVHTAIFDWMDKSRNREVPAKVYIPKTAGGRFPLIVFSHGLGGTRQGYEYVGRHWASHGYVCIHVQHRGSDNKTGKNTGRPSDEMRKAVSSFDNLHNRPRDVTFAIDQVARFNGEAGSDFHGIVDMEKIGIAGHSFGGYTAHAASGRTVRGPEGALDLHDRRIKACVAMSAPARDTDEFRESFSRFCKPCLHITGVHDTSPLGETKVEHRRLPFDSIRSGDQYLVVFRDADHMVFTGRVWPGREHAIDVEIHRLVKAVTILFWDAYLAGNSSAMNLLKWDGLKKMLGEHARVEKK